MYVSVQQQKTSAPISSYIVHSRHIFCSESYILMVKEDIWIEQMDQNINNVLSFFLAHLVCQGKANPQQRYRLNCWGSLLTHKEFTWAGKTKIRTVWVKQQHALNYLMPRPTLNELQLYWLMMLCIFYAANATTAALCLSVANPITKTSVAEVNGGSCVSGHTKAEDREDIRLLKIW